MYLAPNTRGRDGVFWRCAVASVFVGQLIFIGKAPGNSGIPGSRRIAVRFLSLISIILEAWGFFL